MIIVITGAICAVMVMKGLKKKQTCKNKIGLIDLREPTNPSVFHDITESEMRSLTDYLYAQIDLNLTNPSKANINSSYLFVAELHLPSKLDVMEFLGGILAEPRREAIVTIFRGDKKTPCVEEYIVGPLSSPTYHKNIRGNKVQIHFNYRPATLHELTYVLDKITDEVHKTVSPVLYESFGGKLKNCGKRCLTFRLMTPISPLVSKENKRKFWFWLTRSVEYFVLHPVDFAVLVHVERGIISIENVWFHGQSFNSLEALMKNYKDNKIRKPKGRKFEDENKDFSKLYLHPPSYPDQPLRNPIQTEPDGKRYRIIGQNVDYMKWNFHFRMSSVYGPQLHYIRFRDELIVYELGLQEIATFHSGKVPYLMYASYLGTFSLIGSQAKSLVLGSDCPLHSTMISTIHLLESSKEPVKFPNAFCVFEHNMGEPLRRHSSYSSKYDMFYEGMENVVLILRTIVTIVNYDYIFDFMFYQNGVIRVRVTVSGYVLPSPYEFDRYGNKMHDQINGNIHYHAFHFKVDLDINEQQNRFETLNLKIGKEKSFFQSNSNKTSYEFQTEFLDHLCSHERDSVQSFNLDTPKYYLIHNNHKRNHYGKRKAYRILLKGVEKRLSPNLKRKEEVASWTRHHLAITNYKDEERHSSSMYATFDGKDPIVNFNKYIDDDENIVEKVLIK
ncbi:hypothetical protein KUTeg_017585 [Tegillarca granosa]|uniref:Amine oxidase n=1 Tax=Tegillarca granosa TaxID=220873 RepID=A0ABQ9EK85_TEGGR|nr:hypothetical protein KUTeg_017585 [Tegillarca granosa]